MPSKFYITTPIYYVNDRPHIGHVYSTTVADIAARYHRLAGDEVFFTTGVDEHAAKVSDAAAERGLTPQQMADQFAAVFDETFQRLGITNSVFVRTSSANHKNRVSEYVAALLKSGDVYAGEYEGWYDAGQEEYVTDSKAQESNFKSPINGKPLVRKKEKNYFFRLEKYREAVIEAIRGNAFGVEPEARKNEIINRLADARDVPISRTGSGGWGIPVPGDAEQTIYVWIDALFNYLTYVEDSERREFWESGATHVIAKDILWFHAAIWPAMLMALAKCPGYAWVNLPKEVYAHSFWIAEGQKMSKSLGNFVDLEKIDGYVKTFSLDALRYFLASNGPLGTTDSDFAEAKFIEIYNTDLANTLGNCFSRITNMTGRYFGGTLPTPTNEKYWELYPPRSLQGAHEEDREPTTGLSNGYEKAMLGPILGISVRSSQRAMRILDLSDACDAAFSLVRDVDSFIEDTKPFTLAKDPSKKDLVATILYNCAEAIRIASVLLWPVMPAKMEELWRRIGCDYAEQMKANGGRGKLAEWTQWGLLQPGATILQGDPLFPRWQPPKA